MLLLPLLLSAAHADDSTPVLVSSFQAGHPEAAGVASLLESMLAQALTDEVGVEVRRIEDAPRFADYDARTYVEGCPPGDIVGCTLIIGDRVKARYAVTGTVLPLASGARVQVSIVDVADSRVAVSFRSDVPVGGDQAFADAVVKVVDAVIAGQLGRPDDIRDEGSEAEGIDGAAERPSDAELAAQLAELAPELSAATEVLSAPPRSIERPTYTLDDIAQAQEGEGVTAWEQLGMTPGAWLRYKNSGLPLYEWRDRALGHQLELHARVAVGFWRGPVAGTYYNRHAYDPQLTVIDSYSAQVADARGTFTGGGEVAFGLLPTLNVGAAVGWAPASLVVDIAAEGSAAGAEQTTTVFPGALWFGPRVEAAFLPAGTVHPAVGVGATLSPTPRIERLVELPSYAAALPSSMLVYGSVWPGVQVRLGRHLDLYARVPVDFLLAGDLVQEARDTTTAALVPTTPTSSAGVAVSVLAGLQVRMFGRAPPETAELIEEP